MTQSLNIRYAKLSRKMIVMVGLVLATVSLLNQAHWSAEATGFDRRSADADNAIPSLQGAAAITYLKEHKLYESLRTALNAARMRQDAYSVVTPLVIDEQKLTTSDGAAGDEFGLSIAFSGSTLVVGAAGRILGVSGRHAAYVFERQGTSWVETQKLTPGEGASTNAFGSSVALSGSTIVVGAPFDTISGNLGQGSAYVFNRQGGSWTQTQKLIASDGALRAQFGSSVTLSGSTLVVGAPGDTIGDNIFQGSAYVFNHQGGSWAETQKLTTCHRVRSDRAHKP